MLTKEISYNSWLGRKWKQNKVTTYYWSPKEITVKTKE
jgi:hypothetical protein